MTDQSPPLVPTVTFEFDGASYTAIADHMTIVRYERAADRSFAYVMLHLDRVQAIGELPKFSELAYLVQAMLGQHHPDIDLETAMQMAADPAVFAQMSATLGAALPTGKKDASRPLAKAAKRPPAKRKSGTGKD
jgi:hypothetical protein